MRKCAQAKLNLFNINNKRTTVSATKTAQNQQQQISITQTVFFPWRSFTCTRRIVTE